jgi:hypothetical protein
VISGSTSGGRGHASGGRVDGLVAAKGKLPSSEHGCVGGGDRCPPPSAGGPAAVTDVLL